MKLKLKHLASYLPYGLKFRTTFDHLYYQMSGLDIRNSILILRAINNAKNEKRLCIKKLISSKPILFPLSSLTKEITVDGESFVPYDKIKEIYPNTPQFTDYIKGMMRYYGVMNSKCEYVCILKLFEWKIDVFGLIELGLAEPVTENFNPYK